MEYPSQFRQILLATDAWTKKMRQGISYREEVRVLRTARPAEQVDEEDWKLWQESTGDRFFVHPFRAWETFDPSDSSNMRNALVLNSDYWAELTQSAGGFWCLKRMSRDVESALSVGRSANFKILRDEELFSHQFDVTHVEQIPLRVLLCSPGLEVRAFENTADDRLRLELECDVISPMTGDHLVRVVLWLRADADWLIDELKADLRPLDGYEELETHLHVKVTDWASIGDVPFPAQVETQSTGGVLSATKTIRTYSNLRRGPIPQERFLVSHYGLTEPKLVPPQRNWSWILLLNGATALVIACGLRLFLSGSPEVETSQINVAVRR